jgi:hypothetical protein
MSQEEFESEEAEGRSEYVICPVCGERVKGRGRYAHWSRMHADLDYNEYRDKFTPVPLSEAPSPPVRPSTIYKGEEDEKEILKNILSTHPDIPQRVISEVMSWAELGPIHPTQLAYLLSSMKGISQATANIVAQKYSIALQRAGQEGRAIPPLAPSPAQPYQYPPIMGWQQPQAPQQPQPQIWGPWTQWQQPQAWQQPISPPQPAASQWQSWPQSPWQRPLTDYEVREAIRQELRAAREAERPKEEYVDLEEPVRDAEGRVVIGPDDRPVMRRVRVPASQAQAFAPREDAELRVLEKLKMYRDVLGGERLDESKIRDIIRQEVPKAPPEKAVTPEDVARAASEAAASAIKEFIDVREREEREEQRHREVLQALREATSSRVTEGYKEDSMRVVGQALQETAAVIRERKPVEVIIKEGLPVVLGGAPPKEVEEGAKEGLLSRLEKRGWVLER